MAVGKLWALVLAGGEGERLSTLTVRWLGRHRPKQYCTFVGSRSMLQHTYDRVLPIVAAEHVVTLVGKGHRFYLHEACRGSVPGTVIEQPIPRGTAAGVLTGLAVILSQDPEAAVLVVPSDHFMHPETRFIRYAAAAAAAATLRPDRLVLLAAASRHPETEFGWLETGPIALRVLQRSACEVYRFLEKPHRTEAERFHRLGWHWNTMIMAARGRTLWSLAEQHLPELTAELSRVRELCRRAGPAGYRNRRFQSQVLGDVYSRVRSEDFSRALLEASAGVCLAFSMHDLLWDDWGRPRRIVESLARIGKRPAFPLHLAEAEPAPQLGLPPGAAGFAGGCGV